MGREADKIAAKLRQHVIEQERPHEPEPDVPDDADVADLLFMLADTSDDIRLLPFMSGDESILRDVERLERWFVRLVEEVEAADLYQRTIGLSADCVAAVKREVIAFVRVVQCLKRECRDAATEQEMRAA
jgi:hypothetical protein